VAAVLRDGMVHAVFLCIRIQCISYLWSAGVQHPPGFPIGSRSRWCALYRGWPGSSWSPSCSFTHWYVYLEDSVVRHYTVGLSGPNKLLQEHNLHTHIQLVVRPEQIVCEKGSQVKHVLKCLNLTHTHLSSFFARHFVHVLILSWMCVFKLCFRKEHSWGGTYCLCYRNSPQTF
jgi:hypothetical protein